MLFLLEYVLLSGMIITGGIMVYGIIMSWREEG